MRRIVVRKSTFLAVSRAERLIEKADQIERATGDQEAVTNCSGNTRTEAEAPISNGLRDIVEGERLRQRGGGSVPVRK